MSPAARRTDPATSHEAAASVTDLRESHRAVWKVLRARGPMIDEDLVVAYHEAQARGEVAEMSESGIRSRRHELAGTYVVEAGEGATRSGRKAVKWRAVDSRDEERPASNAPAALLPGTASLMHAEAARLGRRSAIFGPEDA
jgi:hypothetical protein